MMLDERINEPQPTDRPNRPQDVRGFVANDALLSRPVQQLVPGIGGAPEHVQETLQQAFSWGQEQRERAMSTRPDRLMPGK